VAARRSTQPQRGTAFIPNPAAANLLKAYLNAGGRVFAEHYHWAWIRSFTGYPSTFGDVATWNAGTGVIGTTARDTLIDQSFPKGIAFASWLYNVGASTSLGHLTLSSSTKYTAIDQINPPSQRWIFEPMPTDAGVPPPDAGVAGAPAQYAHAFSFNTPVGAAESAQCGKFVYTALHVKRFRIDWLPRRSIHGHGQHGIPHVLCHSNRTFAAREGHGVHDF